MKWEKHVVLTDKMKRFIYIKYEFIKFILKFIIKNKYTFSIIRQLSLLKLSKFIRYSSRSYPHTRCKISGRSHFVWSKFNLSRFNFRKLLYNYSACGYKRKSW